jgi:ferredoxin
MGAYGGVKGVLQHNTDETAEASHDALVAMFIEEFMRFYRDEKRRDKTQEYWYRIHWSGDVPDERYAHALKEAIEACPMVWFWGYTRSWFTLPIFAGVRNLQWYISADDDNFDEAWELYNEYLADEVPNISFAYMGDSKPEEYRHRLATCPVDVKKMELEGACQKCKLCLHGAPVYFRIH